MINLYIQIYCILDIEYLKQTLPPTIEEDFYEFLSGLTAKDVTLYALQEGSVAFPRYLIHFLQIYIIHIFM